MRRETWLPLAVIAGLLLAVGLGWRWLDARSEAEAEAAHQAREAERERAEAHEREQAGVESRALLRDVLDGVALEMDLDAVRAARAGHTIILSTSRSDPGFDLYEEELPNGAQVLYAFEQESHLLERVQILSMLEGDAGFAPHLTAMHERYGAPTGIWDCTDGGGISTRRFTWRGEHAALADVVLVYGNRISLTLYVTTNAQMARSLRRAQCRPTDREHVDQFPTSTTEQVQRAQREEAE